MTFEPRAWKTTKGTKTSVQVVLPDGRTDILGGKRAERAEVVLIFQGEAGEWRISGLRADAKAGEAEAHRMRTRTSKRITRHVSRPFEIPCTPNPSWQAIIIEDKEPA